jgi:truncated hemoglobin YjbI
LVDSPQRSGRSVSGVTHRSASHGAAQSVRAAATRELGEFEASTWINGLVQAIRTVKADQESLRLQTEFYERSKHPLDTH